MPPVPVPNNFKVPLPVFTKLPELLPVNLLLRERVCPLPTSMVLVPVLLNVITPDNMLLLLAKLLVIVPPLLNEMALATVKPTFVNSKVPVLLTFVVLVPKLALLVILK